MSVTSKTHIALLKELRMGKLQSYKHSAPTGLAQASPRVGWETI